MYNLQKKGIHGARAGVSSESGSEKSITRSGISAGQITITDESAQLAKTGQTAAETIAAIDRDVLTDDGPNGLSRNWNVHELMKKHQANADIMKMAGQEAGKAVADVSQGLARDLQQKALQEPDAAKRESLLEEAKKWEEGGAYRTAAHAATALLGGGVSAALGSAATSLAAPSLNDLQDHIAKYLEGAGVSSEFAIVIAQSMTVATAAGIGTIGGGGKGQGTAAALNGDSNNRILHAAEKGLAIKLALAGNVKYTVSQIEEQMRLMGSNLEGYI